MLAQTVIDVALSTAVTLGIVAVCVLARFAGWGRDVQR